MSIKATKLPSGMWRARVSVTIDGKRTTKSFTAGTKKQAEFLAAQYEVSGRTAFASGPVTVAECLDEYISTRTTVLSPSTIRSYRQIARCYFGTIMHRRLCDLKNTDLQKLVNTWGQTVSPKTVRNAYTLLTALLGKYRPEFVPDADLPKRIKHEISIPDRDDVARLLEAARGTYLENAILLGAVCGLRRGEICALHYDAIGVDPADPDRPTLTITQAMAENADNEWVTKAPKSFAGTRTIPIPPELVQRLHDNSRRNMRFDPSSRDLISLPMTPDARIYPGSPNALTQSFIKLCRNLGIKCRFHDLRHYNASVMLAIKTPDLYAKRRMGHATTHMLKTVYQHVIQDAERASNDAINAEFVATLLVEEPEEKSATKSATAKRHA